MPATTTTTTTNPYYYTFDFECLDVTYYDQVRAQYSNALYVTDPISSHIKVGDRLYKVYTMDVTDKNIYVESIDDFDGLITFNKAIDDSETTIIVPTGTFTIEYVYVPTTTTTTTIAPTTTTTTTSGPTTTTTTTASSVVIRRTPSGNVEIGDSVTFSVVSGLTDCYFSSVDWYLNDVLVGTGNPFVLKFTTPSVCNVKASIKYYTNKSWLGGHLYGGTFNGNFSGGTFHYGNLNDCYYVSDIPKSKKFTFKI